jgi:hypothetical protein
VLQWTYKYLVTIETSSRRGWAVGRTPIIRLKKSTMRDMLLNIVNARDRMTWGGDVSLKGKQELDAAILEAAEHFHKDLDPSTLSRLGSSLYKVPEEPISEERMAELHEMLDGIEVRKA